MVIVHKCFAYITNANNALLVFVHNDYPEAGIQVVAGTVEDHESPRMALFREIEEETGYPSDVFGEPRFLGKQCFDVPTKNQRHVRHFYHVHALKPLPATWSHEECFGVDEPTMFTFYWCDLNALDLIAQHDALVDRLLA